MRLYATVVMRNEADRYLASMLMNVNKIVDDIFVWDDQSTDKSWQIALDAGAMVSGRPDNVPSFLQNEGAYRQAAWDTFEACLQPDLDSWILAIDADECLVAADWCGQPPGGIRETVNKAIQEAERQGCLSVLIPVPEVFGFDDDGTPLIRVDGLWPTVAGTVLFKYLPRAKFRDKAMGCGREPEIVTTRYSQINFGLNLLHYGYAHEPDQALKHARYTALVDHGHNNTHVNSIVGRKTLKRWEGPVPVMTRGDTHLVVDNSSEEAYSDQRA